MVKCFRKILMNCFSFENWKSTDMGGGRELSGISRPLIPRIQISESRDRKGGVNFLLYHAPSHPKYLNFEL